MQNEGRKRKEIKKGNQCVDIITCTLVVRFSTLCTPLTVVNSTCSLLNNKEIIYEARIQTHGPLPTYI